jgi:hypothetical protein
MVTPKQGDLIFIDAEPHAGHEEGGHRPQSGHIRRPDGGTVQRRL